MSSPSKRHSHRHGSGRKLRRLPKFSDNPPAQHEIVEKNDLLSALSGGGGGKKQEDCDNVSSSDDTSPSKSNGHAAAGVDGEDKVGISLTCTNVLASASD